jgi:hypothetical protein
MMRYLLALALVAMAAPLPAQEFGEPFDAPAAEPKAKLGIFGFGVRMGVDFEGEGQLVASTALDLGYVLSSRLRLRGSADIGIFGGDNTYVGNLELVFRILPDTSLAVPYAGLGVGLFGRAECEPDPECPSVWAQFVLGFEVRLRDEVNWLVEYHPQDAFRRQRVLIGLTTRRRS